MRNFLKCLIAATLLLSLSACYHPDIQQGNDLNDAQVKQLQIGMSRQQVFAILGEPVLNNLFDRDTLTYVYTNNPNRGKSTERKVILRFKQNRLSDINDSGLKQT